MLVSFNNVSFTAKTSVPTRLTSSLTPAPDKLNLRTGMHTLAKELGLPCEKLPETLPLPEFNFADYDILSGTEKLSRKEGVLLLRAK